MQVEWEGLNIADALNLTVEQALARFVGDEIRACLGPVRAAGLGYLTLGHPVSKLSGGEAQRLKIATVLTDSMREKEENVSLLILDEPTTGLHEADIHVLLDVFSKLVIMGHTVVVVEHNLDVLSQADLLIDLGPEGATTVDTSLRTAAPRKLPDRAAPTPARLLPHIGMLSQPTSYGPSLCRVRSRQLFA